MNIQHNSASAVAAILKDMEATADASYAQFCAVRTKCTTVPESVLGVRMGVLRKTCKDLIKAGMDYEMAQEVLLPKTHIYEYKIIYGGVIQRICPPEKVEEEIEKLLKLTDGWATCDFFVEPIAHFAKKGHDKLVLDLMEQATRSEHAFARRVSIVIMIRLHKLGLVSVAEVIDRCSVMQGDDEYYVKMAIAWVLAEMYVHDSPSVHLFIHEGLKHDDIRKMLIRKLKDSYRVDDY